MSQQDIRKVLGNPTTINHHEGGGQFWVYTRGTLCAVKIDLDRDGVVEQTDHDH
jgi:hypothetical protein